MIQFEVSSGSALFWREPDSREVSSRSVAIQLDAEVYESPELQEQDPDEFFPETLPGKNPERRMNSTNLKNLRNLRTNLTLRKTIGLAMEMR